MKKEIKNLQISHFSFIVTDQCNFNCSYCFQKKENKYLEHSTIEKAVTFFYPFFKEKTDIIFYGGEPLLAFEAIKHAVSLLKEKNKAEKKIVFSLTSNGSLIDHEMLDFFHQHGFSIMLSFDGLAQDIARKAGTMTPTLELIQRIQKYPGIEFSINSVFTTDTVDYLSESLRFIIESGGTEVLLSLDSIHPWNRETLLKLEEQLKQLTGFLFSHYKEKEIIPATLFRPPEGPPKKGFVCTAGLDRMAVSPDEELWGCFLFHDYLKDKKQSSDYLSYSFGPLDQFMEMHKTLYPEILANYADLRQDSFFTGERFCFLCEAVEQCGVCPVNAAYPTSFIGKIPTWQCSLNRILKKEKDKFFKMLPPHS
jgi:MoaA/NifB/PqqE/SkfB family radical SAM enzyme